MNEHSTEKKTPETVFLPKLVLTLLNLTDYIFSHLCREISFPNRMSFNLDLDIRKLICLVWRSKYQIVFLNGSVVKMNTTISPLVCLLEAKWWFVLSCLGVNKDWLHGSYIQKADHLNCATQLMYWISKEQIESQKLKIVSQDSLSKCLKVMKVKCYQFLLYISIFRSDATVEMIVKATVKVWFTLCLDIA